MRPDGEEVVKFWPINYYNANGAGGYIQLKYTTGFYYELPCDGIIGDINNDNLVNVVDVVNLVSYILNDDIGFNECELLFSDINTDNLINVVDVVNLVSMILN